jgi:serine/threonine-protein kinase
MKLCPRCREPYGDDASFCSADGVALVQESDPLVGRTLAGRYRLLRRLGAGGMAIVYLARHVMIERLSAIKVLRGDLGLAPSYRERFHREARAVNRINHPNIVEITDFGEDAGLVYLVMEYVEGETLSAILRRGPLPWRRATRIGLQISSALVRTHELGVVHRDLKPENILISSRGVQPREEERVKLTDFGIAKLLDSPSITYGEQRFGTPGFIAPEYIEGEAPGPLCDLYALGMVMYEVVSGTLPFSSVRPADLLAATLAEDRIPLGSLVHGLPAEFESLVMRMIARRPEERPKDAVVVHESLARVAQQQSEPARERAAAAARSSGALERSPLPPPAITTRWHSMFGNLASQLEAASNARGDSDASVRRGRELTEHARALVDVLDRAASLAAGHQERVDQLEAHGRAFRASLGNAIDTLSRDRSHERACRETIDGRRAELRDANGGTDAWLWEVAALDAESRRLQSSEDDLGGQIQELQRQLDAQNEALEVELAEASGRLEGALLALRRLTGELARTVEEATQILR